MFSSDSSSTFALVCKGGRIIMVLRIKSVFKTELLNYRDLLLSTGIKNVTIERHLNFFDDFICEHDIKEIIFTKEMVGKWYAYRSEQGEATKYIRINFSIRFLNYLRSKGYDVVIPRLPRYVGSKQQSYIFSEEEIEKYFRNIDTYYSRKDPMVALYLPVIFRLLYSCGTRIGETLDIKVKDVNLKNGIIILHETKNKKDRMIIVSDSMNKLLNQYADKCLYLKNEDDYFFAHKDHKRVDEQSIYRFHRKALEDSGITYIGNGFGPRLHDWRHTFCLKSLINFEEQGCDLNNVLPILSKYVGHSKITSTERYLKLVPNHFEEVIAKTRDTTAFIGGDDYEE